MNQVNISLKAQERTVFGKKVKHLRHDGKIPANVYGSSVKSKAVTVSESELKNILKAAGENSIINLNIDGEDKSRPTLIYKIQTSPLDRHLLHVDFRQVNLKEKIKTEVALELIGESKAEAEGNVVLLLKNEVEIEALPTDIPENLTLDISKLEALGDTLTVQDIKIDTDKVKILLEPEEILVKVEEPKEEEVQPETTELPEQPAEGEAPAQGAEEGKEEHKEEAKKE